MTDRHMGYIVVLEGNIRDDDAQATIAAIKQIKGVLGVEPAIANHEEVIAYMRAEQSFKQKLIDMFFK